MTTRFIGPQECDQRRYGTLTPPPRRAPVMPAALTGLALGWGLGLLCGLGWVS
jgi:hypothetical protein